MCACWRRCGWEGAPAVPLWRPGLCYAPSSPSSTTIPSKMPMNCCSFSSMHSTTTSKRCSDTNRTCATTHHVRFMRQTTVKSKYVFVYKVAKRQMRSSIRQPRQAHNRNCASAAGEATVVSHLFEGQLSYMTLCMHCDHQAHSTQTFTVLSLPIPTDTIKCSIQVTCCAHYAPLETSPIL